MDGQTREGEAFGLKPNQAMRHGREARRVFFAGRKHRKPPQGGVPNTLDSFRNGAVGFINWLDLVIVQN